MFEWIIKIYRPGLSTQSWRWWFFATLVALHLSSEKQAQLWGLRACCDHHGKTWSPPAHAPMEHHRTTSSSPSSTQSWWWCLFWWFWQNWSPLALYQCYNNQVYIFIIILVAVTITINITMMMSFMMIMAKLGSLLIKDQRRWEKIPKIENYQRELFLVHVLSPSSSRVFTS